jgi:cytochrome P450
MVERAHLGQEFAPLKAPHLENPYPFYARARHEEPVFFSKDLNAWVVTRYDDVRAVVAQPDVFSSKDTLRPVVQFTPETFRELSKGFGFLPNIINTDGEEHMRFRAPLNQAFLPARMRKMEADVRTVANRLIDTFYQDGQTEIISRFAGPLPQEIILRLFDVPLTQMTQYKQWCDDIKALTMSPLTPERQLECARSFVAFQHAVAGLAEERKHTPGDDVISCMATVHHNPARPLSIPEIVNTAMGTILAGHDTTTSLLGTALYILLGTPRLWQTLCEHPENISTTVEEVLRFDSSVHLFFRTALREATVGGVTIPEGAFLLVSYASANHDETQFANAEQFDLRRSPNRHIAFGFGSHFCVGSPLARLISRVALESLTQRLPQMHLKPGQSIHHVPQLAFHGLASLELEWDVIQ